YSRSELQVAIEYRANLLLDLFEEVIIVVTSLAAVLVLFSHTGVINGWTLPQMIVLLGVYYLIQGINSVVFEASFERFMEHVRLGTLDYILIKPANSQFMISMRHFQVAELGQLGLGALLVFVGVAQIDRQIGVIEVVLFAATLTCGLLLVDGLLLVL